MVHSALWIFVFIVTVSDQLLNQGIIFCDGAVTPSSLHYSFHRESTHCVPDTMLGTGDIVENRINIFLPSWRLLSHVYKEQGRGEIEDRYTK